MLNKWFFEAFSASGSCAATLMYVVKENMMKNPAITMLVLLGILATAFTQQANATLITSSIMDDNGEWTVQNSQGLSFLTAVAGIAPTAGTETMHFNNLLPGGANGTNTLVFSPAVLLGVGTYVASIDVGNYNNAPFADIGPIGMTASSLLLTPTSLYNPTPASGAIETWLFTYVITAGDPNLNAPLGFSINVPYNGQNKNASFDNLIISQVPAPATLALLGLGLAAFGWSQRKRAT
jgi:hypothetical protein